MNNLNIKKGDTVKVISGKDKGKSGKVLQAYSVTQRVLVEGINLYKKHVKPRRQGEKGQHGQLNCRRCFFVIGDFSDNV